MSVDELSSFEIMPGQLWKAKTTRGVLVWGMTPSRPAADALKETMYALIIDRVPPDTTAYWVRFLMDDGQRGEMFVTSFLATFELSE